MNTCHQLLTAFLLQLAAGGTACAVHVDDGNVENNVSIATGSPGYFTVRPDIRDCPAPTCGGFLVKLVNQQRTTCADGQVAEECYVAELDPTPLGLSNLATAELRAHANEFLLHGSIVSKDFPRAGLLGSLRLDEAWRGHRATNPRSVYFRARSSGIVCITFPCPSFEAEKLNFIDTVQKVADVDLTGLQRDTGDAQLQLYKAEGLLLTGSLVDVTGPAGSSLALRANEYYMPFTTGKEVPAACGARSLAPCPTGEFCNFPIENRCGATDLLGVCTAPPTICYKLYKPVCGCDGKTYSNECEAAAQSQSVDHLGPC